MAGFNKFPTKHEASSASGGGGGSSFPVFAPDQGYQGPLPDIADGTSGVFVCGFDNNGDYIEMPITAGGVFKYWDNTGTQITAGSWSGGVAVADINAACDTWAGPMYDATTDLIYLCGVDTTTAPDTFYLASINKGGTLSNLWNQQITTDFSTTPTFNISAGNAGAACLYRTADGDGNFFVRTAVTGGVEEAEFNFTTGAVVTDTHTIIAKLIGCPYKTAAGDYISVGDLTLADNTRDVFVAGKAIARTYMTMEHGLGGGLDNTKFYYLQWGGRVVAASGLAGNAVGPRAYNVTEFDNAVDDLAAALGV